MNDNFADTISQKSDQELIDIFVNKEKYQSEFYNVAVAEINKRQIDVSILNEQLSSHVEADTAILEKGKDGNVLYLIICFLLALIGGLIGIIGGYIYAFSTKKGLDGNTYYVYNDTTRKYGKVIFYTGIAIFVFAVITRIM